MLSDFQNFQNRFLLKKPAPIIRSGLFAIGSATAEAGYSLTSPVPGLSAGFIASVASGAGVA